MLFNFIRNFRMFKNRLRYKLSPQAMETDLRRIINRWVLNHPDYLIDNLEKFEGVTDYNYDSKGNFNAVLASGTKITIKTEIENHY